MTNLKIRNRPADDAASQQNVTAWPTEAVVAHRQTVRAAQKTDVALLTASRVDGNGASTAAPSRLVSVLIPIGSGKWPADAIGSVLGGTHDEVEIIVLANPGAGTPPPGELSAGLPGIRRIDVSPGAPGDPPSSAWARAVNRGQSEARGAWITILESTDRFVEDGLEVLVDAAVAGGLEAVYGRSSTGRDRRGGSGSSAMRPDPSAIVPGCDLVSSMLAFVAYDPEAWLEDRTPSAERWRRLLAAGVRLASIDHVVAKTPSGSAGARGSLGLPRAS